MFLNLSSFPCFWAKSLKEDLNKKELYDNLAQVFSETSTLIHVNKKNCYMFLTEVTIYMFHFLVNHIPVGYNIKLEEIMK
jgi:hypothetical protein